MGANAPSREWPGGTYLRQALFKHWVILPSVRTVYLSLRQLPRLKKVPSWENSYDGQRRRKRKPLRSVCSRSRYGLVRARVCVCVRKC